MNAAQMAAVNPMGDRIPRQSHLDELRVRHEPMLTGGHRPNPLVRRLVVST
jgi:hypothetical protein